MRGAPALAVVVAGALFGARGGVSAAAAGVAAAAL
eukprot:gene1405-5485_t